MKISRTSNAALRHEKQVDVPRHGTLVPSTQADGRTGFILDLALVSITMPSIPLQKPTQLGGMHFQTPVLLHFPFVQVKPSFDGRSFLFSAPQIYLPLPFVVVHSFFFDSSSPCASSPSRTSPSPSSGPFTLSRPPFRRRKFKYRSHPLFLRRETVSRLWSWTARPRTAETSLTPRRSFPTNNNGVDTGRVSCASHTLILAPPSLSESPPTSATTIP
ncbi:hypothetical protein C8R46DRAFT_1278167, partial [Mycena filopes]